MALQKGYDSLNAFTSLFADRCDVCTCSYDVGMLSIRAHGGMSH
jgi:hypothetical protein